MTESTELFKCAPRFIMFRRALGPAFDVQERTLNIGYGYVPTIVWREVGKYFPQKMAVQTAGMSILGVECGDHLKDLCKEWGFMYEKCEGQMQLKNA